MDEHKYWTRITQIYSRQREKGKAKYGFTLEENPAETLERLNHVEEELIDALMYIEWIKEKFGNL